MHSQIEQIKKETQSKIQSSETLAQIEEIKISILGKKGILTDLLKGISQLPADQKPQMGALINQLKNKLLTQLNDRYQQLKTKELETKLFQNQPDITLPEKNLSQGKTHPLNIITEEIKTIFKRMNFSIETGPDIETEYYNFEALNIPSDHPARDMHDTFYLTNGTLLRTHTSPVQIHVMENQKSPIKIIVPGTVYRCDADITHSPVFHQIEGLYVDKNVTFAHLKGTLEFFIQELFGKDKKVRFRPSYFPFTEPSAEVDVQCVMCEGKGCNVCKHTGWLEILGCGMVNKNVFRHVKIDPNEFTGFAFGMGIERIAMLKYRINDIRLFYENDLRFLNQFAQ